MTTDEYMICEMNGAPLRDHLFASNVRREAQALANERKERVKYISYHLDWRGNKVPDDAGVIVAPVA